MTNTQADQPLDYLHLALPGRLTDGIVVLRTTVNGAPAIATNVAPAATRLDERLRFWQQRTRRIRPGAGLHTRHPFAHGLCRPCAEAD